MKSSKDQLQKRGMATQEEIILLSGTPDEQLLELLQSDIATTRTAASYNLSPIKYANELLKQLSIEKSLYTKIAICESLQKGNVDTASKMTEYLGKIGNNHHKQIPQKVSLKKSYPLPRDIIARSLGKMRTDILPVLLEVLKGEDIAKISEVLDAVGFMVFYNVQLVNEQNAEEIYTVIGKYEDSDLILWKAIMCLSAFPLPKSLEILNSFILHNNILAKEAERSIKLIVNNDFHS